MTDPPPAAEFVDTFGIAPKIYHRRYLILSVLCLSLVLIVISVSSVNVALPTLARELGATSTQLQWIVDSYALVFAGLLLPAGAIGDRFGRKWALLGGLTVFAICAVWASRSGTPGELIIARGFMGVGAAFIMPATLSIITNSFPAHERTKAIAIWAGFAGAGGAIGPVVSGLMLEHYWWGSIFFVNLPIVLLLMVLAIVFVPNSRDPSGHALDPVGAGLSVAGLVALVFAIIQGPEWGWLTPGVLGSFAAAVAFLGLFIWWELRVDYPTLDPRLFKLPGFGMGSLAIATAFFCMFGMFFLVTQYLQFVLGDTPLMAGVKALPAAAMMILVSPRSPAVAEKIGVRNTTRLGFALMALGFVGFTFLDANSGYGLFAASIMGVAGGLALLMPPSTSAIIASLPLAKAGVGSAVNDVNREVGGAIGIAMLGSILNSVYRSSIDLTEVDAAVPDAARAQFAEAEEAITEGIAGAQAVSAEITKLPFPGADKIAQLIQDASSSAFVSGMGISFAVAAGIAVVIGLVLVGSRIPDELPNEEEPLPQPDPV